MRTLLTLLTFLLFLTASAQKGTLKGGLVDPVTETGIDGATVALLRPDSSVVAETKTKYQVEYEQEKYSWGVVTSVSDNEKLPAEFSFEGVEASNYLLRITKRGYDTLVQPVSVAFQGRAALFDAGDLWLYKESKTLGEATVTGTRLKFVYKGDTLVYNAAAFLTQDGDMLGDLVAKLPGASYDDEGNILVNGRRVESLLINGKDFFNGDIDAALRSLPAFTVNKIKTYEKAGERSETTGTDMGDKTYVMDVRLKRQYERTWSGRAEAHGGTDGRYRIGFDLRRLTDRSSFFTGADANNIGTDLTVFNNGFTYDRNSKNSNHYYRTAFLNFHFEPDRKFKFGITARVNHTHDYSFTRRATETYMEHGNTFGRSESARRAYTTDVTAGTNATWRPRKGVMAKARYDYAFHQASALGSNRSASYLTNPDAVWADAVLDSTMRADAGNDVLHAFVQQRLREESDSHGHEAKHVGSAEFQKAFGSDFLTVNGFISRKTTAYKTFSLYNLDYPATDDGAADYRHRLYDRRTEHTEGTAAADYTLKYLMNDSVNGQLVISYDFSQNYYVDDNPLYRLDRLADYDTAVPTVFLPSATEALLGVVDAHDSYLRRSHETKHKAAADLRHKWRLANRSWMVLEAGAAFDFSFDRMMYHRDGVRHYVSHTVRFLRPTAMLEWHPLADDESGDRMKIKAEYSMSATSPGLLNLLNIVDESNPLNIRTGNPALKDTRTHSPSLSIYRKWKEKGISLNSKLFYNLTHNAVASQYVLDRTTGVARTMPVNINGNWNIFMNN